MCFVSVLALILVPLLLIDADLFTSTTHLTQLLKTEVALAKKLEAFLKTEYERLDHVEKYRARRHWRVDHALFFAKVRQRDQRRNSSSSRKRRILLRQPDQCLFVHQASHGRMVRRGRNVTPW